MHNLVRVLVLSAAVIGPSVALGAVESPVVLPTSQPSGSDVPSWDRDVQPEAGTEFGFAPLSVTQSGVAYSPAAPAFDPAQPAQPKIADLPAWASSYVETGTDRRRSEPFGILGFGALPEPAAWALILVGTAMICGALRGLIVANRRLARLRDDDEASD